MLNFEITDQHGQPTVFETWNELYRFVEQRSYNDEWGDPFVEVQFGDFEIVFGVQECDFLDCVSIYRDDLEIATLWAMHVVSNMDAQYWRPYGVSDPTLDGWTVDTCMGVQTNVTSDTESYSDMLWTAIQNILKQSSHGGETTEGNHA